MSVTTPIVVGMELASASTSHPVLRCAEEIGAALDRAADVEPIFMSVEAKKLALVELSRQAERVRGLLLKVLAVSEDVAVEDGARSAAAWLAHHVRADHGPSARAGRLADRLGARWAFTHGALVAGRVSEDQASVIVSALDALPADLDSELLAKAEAHLVAEAAHFAPRQLRVLGRRVLDAVAPDIADDEERKQLEAEERRARRRTHLIMRPRGDGGTDIMIRVPDFVAARLKVYLEAFTSPRGRGAAGPIRDPATGERVGHSERLGLAFCALLEALPAEVLPQHGGSATAIVINLDYDQLRAGAGAAELSTGDVISAAEARRMACTAGLIPAVLGGKSEPLDLGRAARLFSPSQRKALAIRDKQCRADGCTIPAAWCEAHHAGRPWSRGGRTDLAEGQLLCSFHHHRAHDDHYDKRRLPNGDVRFSRRR
jgi:hypothetical protein